MWTLRGILVPTDFSDSALPALERALDLSTMFKARVHLLHVLDVTGPRTATLVPEVGFAYPTNERDVYAQLEALRAKYGNDTVHLAASVGKPPEEIVRYASEKNLDLICMTTHGRSGLSRLIIGSTAEWVVRHAACAVLTLRASSVSDSTRGPS